jgi:hypothetical protein
MTATRTRVATVLGLSAAAVLPIVVFAVSRAYTVNAGYYDDWEMTPLVLAMRHGTWLWSSMWGLHNNHRLFVPDIVALWIARTGPWAIPRETAFSVGVAVLTQIVWYRIVCRVVPSGRRIATFVLVTLLIFSLDQGENWIWGFQIAWFIANLSISVFVYALTFRGSVTWTIVALASALVAANSVAYGLDALLVGLIVSACAPRRVLWEIVAWSVFTVLMFGAYVHDFTPQLALPPPLTHPARFGQTLFYAVAFLGAPLARAFGLNVAFAAGFLGLLTYAAAVAEWFRMRTRDAARATSVAALVGLPVIPILTALQIAYARLWQGLPTALSGRYVTASSLLWIALVATFAAGVVRVPRERTALTATAAVLALSWVTGQSFGLRDIQLRAQDVFAAAQVLSRYRTATEDEVKWIWPGEVFIRSLDDAKDGPFTVPTSP